jgi:formate dehydrogenase maturation protein FdhE
MISQKKMDIKEQIVALEQAKEFHHEKYISNLQIIDDKIERIEKQLERTRSPVKRDLLKRSLDWYEEETLKMDEAIETITAKIDSEIERLKSAEEKKKTFEYNIEKIREYARVRNDNALEFVANALEILRAEKVQT